MAIRWKFKYYLVQKHQIYTVSDLQKRIIKKTGVVISVANLCKYVNRTPKMIRLDTMEILCSALDCELNQFLSVTPSPKTMNPEKKRKLSFKNTPKRKIGVSSFPSPSDYEDLQLK